jgi:ankyrin repeat protein
MALAAGRALRAAAAACQTDVVTALLANGLADPALSLELLRAADAGHVDVVAALLADGRRADPTAKNGAELSTAAQHNHICVVRAVLGVALRSAAQRGHADVVAAFLADGRADPAAAYSAALRYAAYNGHVDVILALLADGRADPAVELDGRICAAAHTGHTTILRALLEDERMCAELRGARSYARRAYPRNQGFPALWRCLDRLWRWRQRRPWLRVCGVGAAM